MFIAQQALAADGACLSAPIRDTALLSPPSDWSPVLFAVLALLSPPSNRCPFVCRLGHAGTAAALNYSIGHVGLNAMLFNRDLIDFDWPDGWIESHDQHVEPKVTAQGLALRLQLGTAACTIAAR